MFYKHRLLKGIFYPSYTKYQLRQAEKIQGLWLRVGLLILAFGFIYFIGAFYGVGNERLSKELITYSESGFESIKLLFAFGQTLWGLVFAAFMLFLPALFFWSVTEIPYSKLLTVQTFILFVLIIDKAINMSLAIGFGINQFSSPLSFGVIAQSLSNSELLISFLGSISLLHLWAIFLLYSYIKELTEKSRKFVFGIVCAMYFFLLIMSTLLYYIELESLL